MEDHTGRLTPNSTGGSMPFTEDVQKLSQLLGELEPRAQHLSWNCGSVCISYTNFASRLFVSCTGQTVSLSFFLAHEHYLVPLYGPMQRVSSLNAELVVHSCAPCAARHWRRLDDLAYDTYRHARYGCCRQPSRALVVISQHCLAQHPVRRVPQACGRGIGIAHLHGSPYGE
jgi:hypothetical protein